MATIFELRAQFREVVDFAVKNHPYAAVLVVNRLLPAREVNDAKPAHAEADISRHVRALFIGTAVYDGLGHPPNFFDADNFLFPANHSGDPAHIAVLYVLVDSSIKHQSSMWIRVMKGRSNSRFLGRVVTRGNGSLTPTNIKRDTAFRSP